MKTPGLCWHESEGNIKIKLKKIFSFFSNFQKIGSGGSVKRKIKKLWPYRNTFIRRSEEESAS